MELAVCVLILVLGSVGCFPSKPLNDRPSETWQTWLLVDSQLLNQQLNETTDRRITPKSVFIAPRKPLPDCAEGYKADSMGRCVKIVQIDDQAHMLFILDRLNGMFSSTEEDEEEDELEVDESVPTAGPLQVNIPLGGQSEESNENVHAINKKLDSVTELPTATTVDETMTVSTTDFSTTIEETTLESTTTATATTNSEEEQELKALFFLSGTTTEKPLENDGLIRFPADVEVINSDSGSAESLSTAQIQNLFKRFEQRLASNAEQPQYIYNHRNRDRNGELFFRTDNAQQNPLILRYPPSPPRHHSHHNPKHLSEPVTHYEHSRKRRRGDIR